MTRKRTPRYHVLVIRRGAMLVTVWSLCALACAEGGHPPPQKRDEKQPEPIASGSGASRGSSDGPTPSASPGGPEGQTELVLLGTGTPVVDPRRSGPCVAVVVDDVPYLVDAGPGLVRRAAEAHHAGIRGLSVPLLRRVFVTHLHSDHTVGLPDLLLTPWVVGRHEPLQLHGPQGLQVMAESLRAAFAEDIRVRTSGLENTDPAGSRFEVHQVTHGYVYQDPRVRVSAFSVPHGSFEHAFGYRFETKERSIVISGDTGPSDAVVAACDGCDVLVHEVYSDRGLANVFPEGSDYHSTFHTSALELAEIATAARPKLLVLYHHLLFGVSPEQLVSEVRSGYEGEVVFGRDLDVY